MNQRFTKKERLRKRIEYQQVLDKGERYGNEQIRVYALLNNLSVSRFGMIVGKKYGNAPVRNRFKRIFREAYRLNKSLLNKSVDIIVIPRPEFKDLKLSAIEDKFKNILKQINDDLQK